MIITMILVVEGVITWRRRTLVEGRGGISFVSGMTGEEGGCLNVSWKLHVCLPGVSRYTHFIGIHHGKDTQGRH